MAFKGNRIIASLRRRYPSKFFGSLRSVPSYLRILKRRVKSAGDHSITKSKPLQPIGESQQHFGPRAPISDLFQRKDDVHLKLATQQLAWYETPPRLHHDLLGAVANVGRLEERINYTFKNKMTCVEALKVTSSITPLFFKGMIHKIDRNNRLALLGDRVMSLVLCDIWFPTGNSLSDYTKIRQGLESRASLAEKGRALGMDKELLLPEGADHPEAFQIAEAFEAVIGAIYLDCGKSLEVVKKVIYDMKLADHKFLTPNSQSRNAQNMRELWYHHAEGELLHQKTEFQEGEALALQKETQDVDAPVAEQQADKPTNNPSTQVTAKKNVQTLDHKITTLRVSTEDANTSVEELRDILGIDSQMKVHIKSRVEHLTSLTLQEKKGDSVAFRKSRQGDKPSADSQSRANKKKNTVDDLQSVNSVLSDDSTYSSIPTTATEQQELPTPITRGKGNAEFAEESATEISQVSSKWKVPSRPPKCSSEITGLVEDIKRLNRRRNGFHSRRAHQLWAIEHQVLIKDSWKAAIKKAMNLRKLRLPADLGVLYEEILQAKLQPVLERHQRWNREREDAYAMKQSLTPRRTGATRNEAHAASGQIGTRVWMPKKSKKTVSPDEDVDRTQERQERLPRYARWARHRTGPGDL